MKRRDLLRHLSSHGCSLLREGGRHSWWHNPSHTTVPPNWIPLLPVQLLNPAAPAGTTFGQTISRLQKGEVLQPDGSKKVRQSLSDVLNASGNLMLYDEEVPREGARLTRQRRLTRWTDGSTWLWTSFRNQVGQGEGSSALRFDQVIEQSDTPQP
jgi:hypothetical protein